MEFKPTMHRQPIIGDARCALYSIANLLGDMGILLMNNVNESTNYLQERRFLERWHEAGRALTGRVGNVICDIYPFAIAAPGQRVTLDQDTLNGLQPDPGNYILALIDFARNDGAHTVGCLWGSGEDCILLDPQHAFPVPIEKAYLFKAFEVVGVRWLTSDSGQPPEFNKQDLSHIFNLD